MARRNTGAQNIEAIFELTRDATEKINHVNLAIFKLQLKKLLLVWAGNHKFVEYS